MTQEALKLAIQLRGTASGYWTENEIPIIEKLIEVLAQPERHELQAKGEHPAPCARHCEATAFGIVIKNLKAQLAQPEQLMSDRINYGMSVTQGGKRIDPMSIYKEPEQEPVAWMDADGNVSDNNDHKCFPIPLYTTPPQRTEQPAQQEPMVYEAVWSGGPTNKDYEDAMRLKRLNQLATSPQRRPLTEEDCRTGFREQDAKWTFRNMTAWQVWRTACEWNEAAHGIKENT